MEYWKSAPYLLNFMEDYELKRKLDNAIEGSTQGPDLIQAMAAAGPALLRREDIERYQEVDPGNARLRSLLNDTVDRGTWKLLWIPASLPYYQGADPFSDPKLAGFTKRLVFSSWRVVPKAIASILSYSAERQMIRSFRKKAQNTSDAREKRRPLLRFTFSKGRPTGMAVLGLIYPCRTLADGFDPFRLSAAQLARGSRPTSGELVQAIEAKIREMLGAQLSLASTKGGPADESWYWVAPLLLDLDNDRNAVRNWFARPELDRIWTREDGARPDGSGRGWQRHVQEARQLINGKTSLNALGPPPDDLCQVLAQLAIAGPGVCALRALTRVTASMPTEGGFEPQDTAASLGHAFLHLFNLPEVMAIVRDRNKKIAYWQRVLDYCVAGNLQAVLDEYAHVLIESEGLLDKRRNEAARTIGRKMQGCLSLRTSTAQAYTFQSGRRRVRPGDPLRLRTRFAMRFGDQDTDDASSEPTRADHVRSAFNSPFWPFVLASTSVGQEGLDFHPYCHAVVHWNLPSNLVDMEQREGRVHRYKGHALRKNIAGGFVAAIDNGQTDPWTMLFEAARSSRAADQNDLFPYWVATGEAKIERHVPMLPNSREVPHLKLLRRTLVLYRMVFGQNRQEDLVDYLQTRFSPEEVNRLIEVCRIDLSPPRLNKVLAGGFVE
jgi:hypothetical protein